MLNQSLSLLSAIEQQPFIIDKLNIIFDKNINFSSKYFRTIYKNHTPVLRQFDCYVDHKAHFYVYCDVYQSEFKSYLLPSDIVKTTCFNTVHDSIVYTINFIFKKYNINPFLIHHLNQKDMALSSSFNFLDVNNEQLYNIEFYLFDKKIDISFDMNNSLDFKIQYSLLNNESKSISGCHLDVLIEECLYDIYFQSLYSLSGYDKENLKLAEICAY